MLTLFYIVGDGEGLNVASTSQASVPASVAVGYSVASPKRPVTIMDFDQLPKGVNADTIVYQHERLLTHFGINGPGTSHAAFRRWYEAYWFTTHRLNYATEPDKVPIGVVYTLDLIDDYRNKRFDREIMSGPRDPRVMNPGRSTGAVKRSATNQ